MSNDQLGDRMKEYEAQETGRKFISGLPVYARIDGRGFSKFTKGMNRPYDENMSRCMVETTKILVEKTHATIGYVQSDEISLGWKLDNDTSSQGWFDGKIMKQSTVLASMAASAFMFNIGKCWAWDDSTRLLEKMPHFDARVINLPSLSEITNMFLWRNMDATKNAISMAAHHYYSHNELQGKSGSEKQEMLFQKGINFNDYPYFFKRGTWIRRANKMMTLTEDERMNIPAEHRPEPGKEFMRTVIESFDLPPLNKISNKIEVLFNGSEIISN